MSHEFKNNIEEEIRTMKIINLIENTQGAEGCLCEHGLSFYVETHKHKLLIDTGATGAFITNAGKLGVDLKQVDTVILSHGHYDHAGGILDFVKINPDAAILMQHAAGEKYYHQSSTVEKYIGIDPMIKELPQVVWIDGNRKIDEELFLFSGITGRRMWPSGNRELKVKKNEEFLQDDFCHEQYLVISENGKRILISGCAHNGILNILDKFREIYGSFPDAVISGFHMRKKSGYTEEDMDMIKEIAMELKKTDTVFFTGHCTGEIPYQILKEDMGEQLIYVHSGEEIRIKIY